MLNYQRVITNLQSSSFVFVSFSPPCCRWFTTCWSAEAKCGSSGRGEIFGPWVVWRFPGKHDFLPVRIYIYTYTVCIYTIIYSIIYTVQYYIQCIYINIYIYREIHYIWVSYHVFLVQPISGKYCWVLLKMGLICIYIYRYKGKTVWYLTFEHVHPSKSCIVGVDLFNPCTGLPQN